MFCRGHPVLWLTEHVKPQRSLLLSREQKLSP